MFDKILEILAAIAVAVTGAAGLTTAADNVGRGFDAHAPAAAGVLAEEMAALSERSELAADPEVPPAAALEALEQAMQLAPDAADAGLQRAWEAVTGGDAADVAAAGAAFDTPPVAAPPIDVPVTTGPPTDTPPFVAPPVVAPPVETPDGPPEGIPPSDPGQP